MTAIVLCEWPMQWKLKDPEPLPLERPYYISHCCRAKIHDRPKDEVQRGLFCDTCQKTTCALINWPAYDRRWQSACGRCGQPCTSIGKKIADFVPHPEFREVTCLLEPPRADRRVAIACLDAGGGELAIVLTQGTNLDVRWLRQELTNELGTPGHLLQLLSGGERPRLYDDAELISVIGPRRDCTWEEAGAPEELRDMAAWSHAYYGEQIKTRKPAFASIRTHDARLR